MYTKRVLHEHSPGAKKTNSVSEPWHGGLAVAAAETKGARVTVTSGIFSRAAAANHWRAFESRGECVSETGVDSVKHRVDVPSNATLAYSAVCVSFLLPPGAAREVVFSVAWDFPVASFDDAAAARAEKNGADAFATAFVKRYARYHPHGGEDVPLGAAAPALAALALARASEWEDAVRAWQKPYVDSAKPRTEKKSNADDDADATLIRRPPWFVSALFNELHHLVDAGTVWGRPLGVAGLDGVADSFFVKKFPSLSESEYVSSFAPRATATAFDDFDEGEDGEGGDAFDVAGNGGVWGGSLGRFGFAQNRDAPVYNSLPAYFFGSWGIAKFWPGIDLSVVADLASAVRFEDDAERDTKWAADRVAAQAGDEEDATTTTSQKTQVASPSRVNAVKCAAPRRTTSGIHGTVLFSGAGRSGTPSTRTTSRTSTRGWISRLCYRCWWRARTCYDWRKTKTTFCSRRKLTTFRRSSGLRAAGLKKKEKSPPGPSPPGYRTRFCALCLKTRI
jgi:non-lysosomal glucosylceramidase